jgi:hypothetical protein
MGRTYAEYMHENATKYVPSLPATCRNLFSAVHHEDIEPFVNTWVAQPKPGIALRESLSTIFIADKFPAHTQPL